MSLEILNKLEKICKEVESNPSTQVYENILVEGESSPHANTYADFLIRQGFEPRKTGSQCKVATAEHHLEKNGLRVEIISANHFGSFVEIEIRK